MNVGYSISTSHYSPPYLATRLLNKFVAVPNCKIVLAVLFLFYLFLSYIVVVHSLWIFLTYCWIISYFFKNTEKTLTSLPLYHWSSFSTFWCCSSFIFSFHCNISWGMKPWYSLIFCIKCSTIGKSHFFDASSLLIA